MQDQLCVTINIADSPLKKKASQKVIQNRRYKKLLELRKSGFFSQQAIKLRHPLLYHTYLGKNSHRAKAVPQKDCTLSQFLQKNLMNLEYKDKLEKELNELMLEQKSDMHMESKFYDKTSMDLQVKSEEEKEEIQEEKSWQPVQEEEIQLQEQNLIEHAEQLFMEGKIDRNCIDYSQIDNNSDYDDEQERNRDAEEHYFASIQKQSQELDRFNNTGIQDY